MEKEKTRLFILVDAKEWLVRKVKDFPYYAEIGGNAEWSKINTLLGEW